MCVAQTGRSQNRPASRASGRHPTQRYPVTGSVCWPTSATHTSLKVLVSAGRRCLLGSIAYTVAVHGSRARDIIFAVCPWCQFCFKVEGAHCVSQCCL